LLSEPFRSFDPSSILILILLFLLLAGIDISVRGKDLCQIVLSVDQQIRDKGDIAFQNRMFSAPMGGTDIADDGCIGPKSTNRHKDLMPVDE